LKHLLVQFDESVSVLQKLFFIKQHEFFTIAFWQLTLVVLHALKEFFGESSFLIHFFFHYGVKTHKLTRTWVLPQLKRVAGVPHLSTGPTANVDLVNVELRKLGFERRQKIKVHLNRRATLKNTLVIR